MTKPSTIDRSPIVKIPSPLSQNTSSFLNHAAPVQPPHSAPLPAKPTFQPILRSVGQDRVLQDSVLSTLTNNDAASISKKVEWGDTIYGYWKKERDNSQTNLDSQSYVKLFNELNNRDAASDTIYAGETVLLPQIKKPYIFSEQAPNRQNLSTVETPEDAKEILSRNENSRNAALEQIALSVVIKDITPNEAKNAYIQLKTNTQKSDEQSIILEKEIGRLAKDGKELKVTPAAGLLGGLIGVSSSAHYIENNFSKDPVAALRQTPAFIRGLGDMTKAFPKVRNLIGSFNIGEKILNNVTPTTYSVYAALSTIDIGSRVTKDWQQKDLSPRKALDYAIEATSLGYSTKILTWDVGWSSVYQQAKQMGTSELIKHWSSAFAKLSIADAVISSVKAVEMAHDPGASAQQAQMHERDAMAHSIDAGIYSTSNPLVILGSKFLNVAFAQTLPDSAALKHAFLVERLPLDKAGQVTLKNGQQVLASDSLSNLSEGLGTQALWKTISNAALNLAENSTEKEVRNHYREAAMNYQARAVALALFQEEKRTGKITSKAQILNNVRGLGFVNPAAVPEKQFYSESPFAVSAQAQAGSYDSAENNMRISSGINAKQVQDLSMSLPDQALKEQATQILQTMRHELKSITYKDIQALAEETPVIRSTGKANMERINKAWNHSWTRFSKSTSKTISSTWEQFEKGLAYTPNGLGAGL
jgi:hypothetical protein